MNKYWLSALMAPVVFSANAFARDRDFDDHHDRHYRHRVERVVVHQAYVQPRVVYRVSPQIIYRERPVYYAAAPVYREAPRHYSQPQPYPGTSGDRAVGQVIGAVAGAVIGSQFGHGNGRVVSTVAGAAIGSMVGGSLSSDGD